jgi:hypothetical protein
MTRGNQQLARWNVEVRCRTRADFAVQIAGNGAGVHGDQRRAGTAVIENQRAHENRIEHAGEVAGQFRAARRVIDARRAGA